MSKTGTFREWLRESELNENKTPSVLNIIKDIEKNIVATGLKTTLSIKLDSINSTRVSVDLKWSLSGVTSKGYENPIITCNILYDGKFTITIYNSGVTSDEDNWGYKLSSDVLKNNGMSLIDSGSRDGRNWMRYSKGVSNDMATTKLSSKYKEMINILDKLKDDNKYAKKLYEIVSGISPMVINKGDKVSGIVTNVDENTITISVKIGKFMKENIIITKE